MAYWKPVTRYTGVSNTIGVGEEASVLVLISAAGICTCEKGTTFSVINERDGSISLISTVRPLLESFDWKKRSILVRNIPGVLMLSTSSTKNDCATGSRRRGGGVKI